MPQPPDTSAFWNRIARRYAAMPLRNPEAWETTLARTAAHLRPTDAVLELGCGTGSTALRLAPAVSQYTATDAAAEMIAIAREKLAETPVDGLGFDTARTGDGSLPGGPFDAIVAFNLLHLLPDMPSALAEMRGLLKPGGVLISKTPCLGGRYRVLWPVVAVLRAFGKAPALRFVDVATLDGLVAGADFEIVERGAYPARPPSRFIVARKT